MGNFISRIKELSSKLNGYKANKSENSENNPGVLENDADTQNVEENPPKPLLTEAALLRESSPTPKPLYRRPLFWLSLGGLGLGAGALGLGILWWNIERSLPPSIDEVLTYVRDGTLTIKAADESILQQTGPATREKLKIDQIPQHLIEAFIAIEDRRFYQHQGVDYQGVFRAGLSNLQARNVVEGGSTLTQQLARIIFLDQNRNFWRKLKEFRLAQKIEAKFSKQQILERYLNLVYLGSGAYGVADASWIYFSKSVDELTLPEMAMLAGLPPAPSVYSPLVNDKAAKERRNLVLKEMQESGYITPQEATDAIATPLQTEESIPRRFDREAHYFTEYIQKELPKYVSPQLIETGGLTVETSLNPEWQKFAEDAVTKTIKAEGRSANFSQAALVAIDPRNGEVKAMVGGKDFSKNQFNRVTQAQRQPGSTFKTFVYTTAIAAGFTPHRGYLDAPLTVDGYKPKNFSKKHHGWMSMRDALISSINIVAIKVLIDVGWEPVIEIAHKMGIESPLGHTYSLALGGTEVNALELTSAYGTLANQGLHIKPHGITKIVDKTGKVVYEANFKPERALEADTTAIMNWMLRAVVNEGTGRAAQLDRQVAGKTGTSDEARDLWFIGYIPQMVAGVWLGNDSNKPTWGASSIAAETWHKFMVKAVKGMPVEKFPPRPEELEGRKPQIKTQRIKPRIMITGKIDEEDKSDKDKSESKRSRRNSEDNNRRDRADKSSRRDKDREERRRQRRQRRQEAESAQ